MTVLLKVVAGLNIVANAFGRVVFAPLAFLPGWLSATLVAAGTGVLMLLVFKYTSKQRALRQVRNGIKADLLSLSLFKESVAVSLRAQGRILLGAGKLLLLSIVPMLVMCLPIALLLGQMALWYQVRPLAVGEDTVVTVTLADGDASAWPDVRLEPAAAIEPIVGPVRVASQRRTCWNIRAREKGYHRLVFNVSGRAFEKEVAIGDGFMRASLVRPTGNWFDALRHPLETPFPPESPVQSIEIEYPTRASWTCGSNSWVGYWFLMSLVAALACRRRLNVNL